MISLPNVTLIALTGIGYQSPETIHALQYSQKGIEFGDVKYIQLGSVRDIDSWNKTIIYDLHKYVDTEFCLLVHENGFVVHPESWNPDWLTYDFIGAPWPVPTDSFSYRDGSGNIIRVGNSVSIRSKRLLELPGLLGIEWRPYFGNTNEDGFLCCHNRELLERNGIRFAPLEVAKFFSRELDIPENADVDKPFCFHCNKFLPGRNAEFLPLIGV